MVIPSYTVNELTFRCTFFLLLPSAIMRNYKRKTTKGTYCRQDMLQAVNSVLNDNKSLRTAAKDHSVNYKTLSRYVAAKKRAKDLTEDDLGYKQPRIVFTKEIEEELVRYLIKGSKIFHGLTLKELRQLAYQLAAKNNLNMPESWIEHEEAGTDWAEGFMRRHPQLSVRQPEATSLQRMSSFNKHNVNCFYDNLEEVMKKGFTPDKIWNIDETGVTTVQKPVKQVALKGEKRVGSVTGQERGDLVTVCNSINAVGNHMPPFLVFPRVNKQDHWVEALPPGSKAEGHPKASGWMTQENFLSFLEHFKHHSNPTADAPVLLILDNHSSHVSLDAINFCRENNISLLSFPPHCSHELQPLDKTVYGPFKRYCNQYMDNWFRRPENAGRPMSIHIIPSVVNYGFINAFNQKNILSGFRSTGIYPFDRNAIPDDRYAPSFTTDRPDPSTSTQASSTSKPASDLDKLGFVSPYDIRPFGKAGPRSASTPKRKKVTSEIYTSSPVKRRIEDELAAKQNKGKKVRPIDQSNKSDSDSSEDEPSNFSVHDDSDQSVCEEFSEGEEKLNFELNGVESESLKVGDFVLVEYKTKKSDVHYVGQVNAAPDDDNEVEVDFLRKSSKAKNFIKPNVLELASVPISQIKTKLTRILKGTTLRTKDRFFFKEDLFNDVLKIN